LKIGLGIDVHAFGPGDHLMLAGVTVPYTRGVVAHSDGDVVLHALADAMLGAAGLGDIGEHFSDRDPRWKGADSRLFVREVLKMLAREGYSLGNVDVSVLAEAPKLAPLRGQMRRNLSELLGLPESEVNIKATTAEKLGFIGRAEGIAAYAAVLLNKT
jgi:2-C-methyl-D-erythritol 2,4-cyclodiphosphate synthase